MHHRQRKARRHRGIDSIAALTHDLHAGIGRQVMNAHHHRMLRADWLLFEVIAGGRLGCAAGCAQRQRKAADKDISKS